MSGKMETDTKDIGIKMVKEKESEYTYLHMARSTQENIILINYMDAQRSNFQMVAVIGGKIRMMREMDTEHFITLMALNMKENSAKENTITMEYLPDVTE